MRAWAMLTAVVLAVVLLDVDCACLLDFLLDLLLLCQA